MSISESATVVRITRCAMFDRGSGYPTVTVPVGPGLRRRARTLGPQCVAPTGFERLLLCGCRRKAITPQSSFGHALKIPARPHGAMRAFAMERRDAKSRIWDLSAQMCWRSTVLCSECDQDNRGVVARSRGTSTREWLSAVAADVA